VGTTCRGEKMMLEVNESHQRFVTHLVEWKVKEIEFVPISTYGSEEFRVFRFEVE
jgi:hypothetical protein